MFRMKGRLIAGVLCAMLAAMLVVPVSAHGCHGGRGGGHHGGYARNVQTTVQTAVTVCPYSDCTLAGRHTHSGVIYCGPPLGADADWNAHTDGNTYWRYYNVYQTGDGRIYLNGDGDSVNGLMSKTQTVTNTRTENGKTYAETIQISVALESAQRIERLTVTQFDETNTAVRSDDLALREDLPEIRCGAETAWVLVEEYGGGETARTAYNTPEKDGEPISHQIILLDEEGYGSLAYLHIQ